MNLEKRKKSVNFLRSIRRFNILYAYNKKDQKSFHDIYDPNFSKSGYLNKPSSMIIPFLYSEDLIKKIVERQGFFSKNLCELSIFFSSLNSENQQKCYHLFKQRLSVLVRDSNDFNQFISVLKSENLTRQFIIDHQDSFDETRRALRKQCAVEEPAIGVGCWAKQATHHAVKSWWEARA